VLVCGIWEIMIVYGVGDKGYCICAFKYSVPTISSLLKNIGLFCKRDLEFEGGDLQQPARVNGFRAMATEPQL